MNTLIDVLVVGLIILVILPLVIGAVIGILFNLPRLSFIATIIITFIIWYSAITVWTIVVR